MDLVKAPEYPVEYAEDVIKCLLEAELKNRPKSGYMADQPEITTIMRSILIDWMVEVTEEFQLHDETLYLAVVYLDRALSCLTVRKEKLQLVGTTCLFIASKYEEMNPPQVKTFAYITEDSYTTKAILRMEHVILDVLSYEVNAPTISCFLGMFLKAEQTNKRTEDLAKFLSELTLQEYGFMSHLPSVIAASAVLLAVNTASQQCWTPSYADFVQRGGESCLREMHQLWLSGPSLAQQTVIKKYKAAKFNYVSEIPPPDHLVCTKCKGQKGKPE